MLLVHPATFQILKIFWGLYPRTPFAGAHPTPTFGHARPALHAVRPSAGVPIVPTLRNGRWFARNSIGGGEGLPVKYIYASWNYSRKIYVSFTFLIHVYMCAFISLLFLLCCSLLPMWCNDEWMNEWMNRRNEALFSAPLLLTARKHSESSNFRRAFSRFILGCLQKSQ